MMLRWVLIFFFMNSSVALANDLRADMHAKEGAESLVEWLEEYQEAMKEAQKKAQEQAQKTGEQPKAPQVNISPEKLNLAINEFLLGLGQTPERPDIHINLGLAFELKKSEEQALAEYDTALELLDDQSQLRFIALFNKARLLGQMKKIPEALEVYQEALKMDPTSNEIKTNIELLWQQGGGGSGDSNQQNENQDDQQQKDQQDQQDQQDPEDQKQQQQPKDLSEQDVKRILEEIKNQEQKIRGWVHLKCLLIDL